MDNRISDKKRAARKTDYKRRGLFRNKGAVSNIVSSIMMLGIVMTILGMVLTVYVPIWAKGLEAQHMEDVANSFADLKSTIDSQVAQGDIGTKFSTRIQLGTEGGPLLAWAKAPADSSCNLIGQC